MSFSFSFKGSGCDLRKPSDVIWALSSQRSKTFYCSVLLSLFFFSFKGKTDEHFRLVKPVLKYFKLLRRTRELLKLYKSYTYTQLCPEVACTSSRAWTGSRLSCTEAEYTAVQAHMTTLETLQCDWFYTNFNVLFQHFNDLLTDSHTLSLHSP